MLQKTIQQVAALAVLIVFVSGMVVLGAYLSESSATAWDTVYQEIVVQPGDSLWIIARNFSPAEDPRTVVAVIREMNELQEAMVYPGQRLMVPVTAN